MFVRKSGLLVGLALSLAACASTSGELPEPGAFAGHTDITVIAHRGASGYLPEHTLEAYQLAIDMGADFIEPDLVMTSDGVLVARHDPWLSDSTNVADHPEFADRRTTVTGPDGTEVFDWFVWDFTYEELSSLRARQVRAGRDASRNDVLPIVRFDQVLSLAMRSCRPYDSSDISQGSYAVFGVYPETKWPEHHAERGLDMAGALETTLLTALKDYDCDLPIYVQSFEDGILRDLNARPAFDNIPLVQLVYPEGYALDGAPGYELENIAEYADGVGPFKTLVLDYRTQEPTGYAQRARELGLEIHAWTFRDDDIAPGFATIEDEIRAILDAGATGFFTDFPDTGRAVADEWASE